MYSGAREKRAQIQWNPKKTRPQSFTIDRSSWIKDLELDTPDNVFVKFQAGSRLYALDGIMSDGKSRKQLSDSVLQKRYG